MASKSSITRRLIILGARSVGGLTDAEKAEMARLKEQLRQIKLQEAKERR